MADSDHEEEFDKAFEGFGEDKPVVTPPVADPAVPPAKADDKVEPPKADPEKPAEEPKKDEQPVVEPPKKDETPAPAADEKKPETPTEPPKTPETPPTPTEEPKPLTLDDVKGLINDVRTEERTSGQALETATKDVMEAYYPEGLSNVLVDQQSGKELKTPQDVVDASGGKMPIEEAAQWLMNEQYKLDQDIAKIKNDASEIAKTTLKFQQDGVEVLHRYKPIFEQYPQLQDKVWRQFEKLVKADKEKGVILSAPDMLEFYDTVLEPYRMAVEFKTGQPGTASTTPLAPETPPTPTPTAEDRLDDDGDGGSTAPNDPTDFAQQVSKELAKGI